MKRGNYFALQSRLLLPRGHQPYPRLPARDGVHASLSGALPAPSIDPGAAQVRSASDVPPPALHPPGITSHEKRPQRLAFGGAGSPLGLIGSLPTSSGNRMSVSTGRKQTQPLCACACVRARVCVRVCACVQFENALFLFTFCCSNFSHLEISSDSNTDLDRLCVNQVHIYFSFGNAR